MKIFKAALVAALATLSGFSSAIANDSASEKALEFKFSIYKVAVEQEEAIELAEKFQLIVPEAVAKDAEASAFAFGVLPADSALVSENATFKALLDFGATETKHAGLIKTKTGENYPLLIGSEVDYVKSISMTDLPNGEEKKIVEMGKVFDGVKLSISPTVEGNKISFEYQQEMNELVELKDVTVGDASIQLPKTKISSFVTNVNIEDGETFAVSRYVPASADADYGHVTLSVVTVKLH